ncbi:hypothetical protein GCM10009720_05140 [Yaniella flava]|uniref:Uncharacterized protein n=1 Tax=Yaniella flava TaxID=287930 RepID=A0ABP5FJY0_9MICC
MTEKATRTKSKRTRLLKFFLGTLSALVVVALAVGGFVTWSVFRAFPDTEGVLEVAGLEQSVTVQRDEPGDPNGYR